MVMPSRRRRPLIPRFPLPRATRFILSHRHPVRLRIGERGRQIRRSAPRANIVTSSSKVEAASMSDKCEIRFNADRIQGASGSPGQVAKISNFQATHRGSSCRPPLDLLNIPDEFKSLEMDRLLPCDLEKTSPTGWQQYDDYLEWFYYSHRGPDSGASLADTASMCLEKENSMRSLWVSVRAICCASSLFTVRGIVPYMQIVIEEKGEIEHPLGIDAAKCIANESELISEWLRRGRWDFLDDEEFALSTDIRGVAAQLFISRRKLPFLIAAALLGIRKEAEWLIENPKCNSDESTISMKIRQFALNLLMKKFRELGPYENELEIQFERAFLSRKRIVDDDDDDEDDDDDDDDGENAFSKDNNYVGGCYDEDYLRFGF